MDCGETMTQFSSLPALLPSSSPQSYIQSTHWTRRTFLTTAAFASMTSTRLSSLPFHEAARPTDPNMVYIGSTDNKNNGKGIHYGHWDPKSGTLSGIRSVASVNSPGFLALAELDGQKVLFAGYQSAPKVGALSGYRVQPNGDLTLINTTTAPDFDMVHLALDHTQRTLVAASYGSGKILSVKVSSDGHLSAPVTQIHLTGHGPVASRQKSPHAHGVCATPGNRFILINDLGTDRIMIYKLDPATAELTPNNPAYYAAAPGSGPRHTTFHPNGRWAYSINEINSTITLMNWDAKKGILTTVENYPTLPPGGDVANNRAGEVILSRQGRFLYACNRGAAEEMLAYSVGREGRLTLIERIPLPGKEARHFAIPPDEDYLLVAEQFSDRVVVFSRDREKGTIQLTSNSYELPTPSCILFV